METQGALSCGRVGDPPEPGVEASGTWHTRAPGAAMRCHLLQGDPAGWDDARTSMEPEAQNAKHLSQEGQREGCPSHPAPPPAVVPRPRRDLTWICPLPMILSTISLLSLLTLVLS